MESDIVAKPVLIADGLLVELCLAKSTQTQHVNVGGRIGASSPTAARGLHGLYVITVEGPLALQDGLMLPSDLIWRDNFQLLEIN